MVRAAQQSSCSTEDAARLAALAEQTRLALRRLAPPGSRVALLDYPNHTNVGDSAIWLGERRLLNELGVQVCYTADLETFNAAEMKSRLGDGLVLLHGGGNFGDLWPAHQQFREDVLAACPELPVIQMPQSIFFRDAAAVARARHVVRAHPRFTLLVRERQSWNLARTQLDVEPMLVPDLALSLGPLPRPPRSPDAEPIVWLARTDHERLSTRRLRLASPISTRLRPTDWLETPPTLLRRAERFLATQYRRRPRRLRVLRTPLSSCYDHLAWENLRRGCALLGRGEVVVCDRLHAHILCVLMGIPHFVLDNNYGKIRACLEAWTSGFSSVRFCASRGEAFACAQQALQA